MGVFVNFGILGAMVRLQKGVGFPLNGNRRVYKIRMVASSGGRACACAG